MRPPPSPYLCPSSPRSPDAGSRGSELREGCEVIALVGHRHRGRRAGHRVRRSAGDRGPGPSTRLTIRASRSGSTSARQRSRPMRADLLQGVGLGNWTATITEGDYVHNVYLEYGVAAGLFGAIMGRAPRRWSRSQPVRSCVVRRPVGQSYRSLASGSWRGLRSTGHSSCSTTTCWSRSTPG